MLQLVSQVSGNRDYPVGAGLYVTETIDLPQNLEPGDMIFGTVSGSRPNFVYNVEINPIQILVDSRFLESHDIVNLTMNQRAGYFALQVIEGMNLGPVSIRVYATPLSIYDFCWSVVAYRSDVRGIGSVTWSGAVIPTDGVSGLSLNRQQSQLSSLPGTINLPLNVSAWVGAGAWDRLEGLIFGVCSAVQAGVQAAGDPPMVSIASTSSDGLILDSQGPDILYQGTGGPPAYREAKAARVQCLHDPMEIIGPHDHVLTFTSTSDLPPILATTSFLFVSTWAVFRRTCVPGSYYDSDGSRLDFIILADTLNCRRWSISGRIPEDYLIDPSPACDYPTFDLRDGLLEGTYIRSTAAHYAWSADHGRTWNVETIPGSYTAQSSGADRHRRVFCGWTGTVWQTRVKAPERAWTGAVNMNLTNPTGQGALAVDPETSKLTFTYRDTAGTWRTVTCNALGDDGSGVWR